MLKTIFKFLLKGLLYVFGAILLYAVAVFVLPKITIDKENDSNKDIEVFIITNGVHTDIVVPVESQFYDWSKDIQYGGVADSTYKYLAMGWGDKGFYLETPTWAELKVSVALKAAFGLSTTAMHCTFYKSMTINESCKSMWMSENQYERLVNYIKNSLEQTENNNFMVVDTKVRYGNTDIFYEANGSYGLFKTCNTWANEGLKVSGQKCCYWTALDWGIFDVYE